MKHKMSNNVKRKFIKGKWYKDNDGWFHKFLRFDNDMIMLSATVYDGQYVDNGTFCGVGYFNNKCTPMTITEMKQYLPEKEWWVEEWREQQLKEIGI